MNKTLQRYVDAPGRPIDRPEIGQPRGRAQQKYWTTGQCPVKILLGPVETIKHWTTWSSE